MADLYKTAIVEKRNVLNELRSNNMTVQELRFFSIYLSKINPWDVSTRVVRFPIEDFQRIMGFGKINISQLRASTDSLLSKIVHIPIKGGGFRAFQLFKECCISQDENGKWFMEIDAHDRALPLMFDFKNKYFKYELWNALRLKSPNQVRMYEILKQYENIGRREVTIQELRELLGVAPNEYADRWDNFKRKVLDSCKQALKETTDICFSYERGKVGKGGKWLSIIFHIEKNTEYVDQLTLEEFIDLQPEAELLDEEDLPDVSETVPSWYTETLELLSEACNNEFSHSEIDEIFVAVTNIPTSKLPERNGITDISLKRYHYLQEKYVKLNRVSEQKEIKNRYAYFLAMIKADAAE